MPPWTRIPPTPTVMAPWTCRPQTTKMTSVDLKVRTKTWKQPSNCRKCWGCTFNPKLLDLSRARYGVKYIDLVSLQKWKQPRNCRKCWGCTFNPMLLDLSRAPCVSYEVKYIGLVSLQEMLRRTPKCRRVKPHFLYSWGDYPAYRSLRHILFAFSGINSPNTDDLMLTPTQVLDLSRAPYVF